MAIFKEGNYNFPKWPHDPGAKRFDEALKRAGLSSMMEVIEMVNNAKTEEEKFTIRHRVPLKTAAAVGMKKMMGREEFLAQDFNLDYVNSELGDDWMDKY
ncbi:MAG: hypothetical protein ACRCTY_06140 [Candidatus Adiutrix sp.]